MKFYLGLTVLCTSAFGWNDFKFNQKMVSTAITGAAKVGKSLTSTSDMTHFIAGAPDNDSQKGAGVRWEKNTTFVTSTNLLLLDTVIGQANYGEKAAISPDNAVVALGAPNDDSGKGAVFAHIKSGSVWDSSASTSKIKNSIADQFGTDVALSTDGTYLAVGAEGDATNAGTVYIYNRSGTTWAVQGNKLTGTGATGAAEQGSTVALSGAGDILVSGGPADDSNKGAVWVFKRSGTTWSQVGSKLVGTGMTGASKFGFSVSLTSDGLNLVIGGNDDDSNKGAVWFFTCTTAGACTQKGTKLVGMIAASNFGISVHIDGTVAGGLYLAVGAAGAVSNMGYAYLYEYVTDKFVKRQEFTPSSTAGPAIGSSAYFGFSVRVSQSKKVLLVGGYGDDSNKGAVWAYSAPANPLFSAAISASPAYLVIIFVVATAGFFL